LVRGKTLVKIRSAVIKSVIQSGVNGVKIRDIAKKANSSEALLFKYYKDKNDLIRKTFIDIANEFYNFIKSRVDKVKSQSEKLEVFIDSFVDFSFSRKQEFLFILKMYQFHYDEFIKKTPKPIDILKEIAPAGKYGKEWTIAFVVSVLTRMLEFYFNGQIKDNKKNLRKNIKEIISFIL
jgi:AcrR family transcriptional regulator